MATILGPLDGVLHDAANSLLTNNVPTKLATSVNTLVTSAFGVVGDVLGIVRDMTAPAAAPTPSP